MPRRETTLSPSHGNRLLNLVLSSAINPRRRALRLRRGAGRRKQLEGSLFSVFILLDNCLRRRLVPESNGIEVSHKVIVLGLVKLSARAAVGAQVCAALLEVNLLSIQKKSDIIIIMDNKARNRSSGVRNKKDRWHRRGAWKSRPRPKQQVVRRGNKTEVSTATNHHYHHHHCRRHHHQHYHHCHHSTFRLAEVPPYLLKMGSAWLSFQFLWRWK
jgi:hypothetical protein